MKDEIWAGLKNAVERGASIEQAVQSFISAGYNPAEIKEAAERLGQGATSMINAQQTAKTPQSPVQQPSQVMQNANAPAKPEMKNMNNSQSVELSQGDNKPASENNIFTGAPNKVLYVPGAQNKTVQQPSQVMQNANAPAKPIEYIPFGGVDSTRKKKIILLLGFLILLVGLLIIAIFYNQQIFDFLKKFYE